MLFGVFPEFFLGHPVGIEGIESLDEVLESGELGSVEFIGHASLEGKILA
jgi:hypothetical protein